MKKNTNSFSILRKFIRESIETGYGQHPQPPIESKYIKDATPPEDIRLFVKNYLISNPEVSSLGLSKIYDLIISDMIRHDPQLFDNLANDRDQQDIFRLIRKIIKSK